MEVRRHSQLHAGPRAEGNQANAGLHGVSTAPRRPALDQQREAGEERAEHAAALVLRQRLVEDQTLHAQIDLAGQRVLNRLRGREQRLRAPKRVAVGWARVQAQHAEGDIAAPLTRNR